MDDEDEVNNAHGDVNLSWRTASQRMLHSVWGSGLD